MQFSARLGRCMMEEKLPEKKKMFVSLKVFFFIIKIMSRIDEDLSRVPGGLGPQGGAVP